jgi:ankyrin repeat protein
MIKVLMMVGVFMIPCIVGCAQQDTKTAAKERLKQYKAADWFSNRNEIEFCQALEKGDTNQMRKLLDNGLDINTLGQVSTNRMTFIVWSLFKQSKTSYQYLLEHGADPNKVSQDVESGKIVEFSAVTLSVLDIEDSFYLKLALEHGGNPNVFSGYVPIIFDAIDSYSITNVQLLVDAGANVNEKSKKSGDTPLIRAITFSRYDIAYLLLERGANPNLIDKDDLNWALTMRVMSHLQSKEDYYKQVEYRKKVIKKLEDMGIKLDLSRDLNVKKGTTN